MVRPLLERDDMSTINAPRVIAELSALHDAYERALCANDVPALKGFFWDSPQVVRYGLTEHLYGAESVARYRDSHAPNFTDRRIVRREILALDANHASIMCELSQLIHGQRRHSRQSQVWCRFSGYGWRIVSAHVSQALPAPGTSLGWESYVNETAAAIGLPLHSSHREGVIQNLQRAASLAAPLLALQLPADTSGAPVFVA